MSCDPNDYTSAALILQGLVNELRDAGENVTSGEQWVARIQERARQLTGELMARNALRDELAALLGYLDCEVPDSPNSQKADLILQRYTLTRIDEEVPF